MYILIVKYVLQLHILLDILLRIFFDIKHLNKVVGCYELLYQSYSEFRSIFDICKKKQTQDIQELAVEERCCLILMCK